VCQRKEENINQQKQMQKLERKLYKNNIKGIGGIQIPQSPNLNLYH